MGELFSRRRTWMRSSYSLVAPAIIAASLAGQARGDDFDPAGRVRAHSAPPSRPASVARDRMSQYEALVLAQPGAEAPLERWMQLYRERDGDLHALTATLQTIVRAGGSQTFAATMALGGIYRREGVAAQAKLAWEGAILLRPASPLPLRALAALEASQGEIPSAREHLERALRVVSEGEKGDVLRTLVKLALDAKDFEAASRWGAALVATSPGSLALQRELGHELMNRGELEHAEREFARALAANAGDARAELPLRRDLASAQLGLHHEADAIRTLARALAASGSDSGLKREILHLLIDAHRGAGTLPALAGQLEHSSGGDAVQLAARAAVEEEIGAVDRAIATYRSAISVGDHSPELRLALVRLLQSKGAIAEATAELARLVREAPRRATYLFELCELLIQRGDRSGALRRLSELEQRSLGDDDTLGRIADFYDRLDEKARAVALYTRVVATHPANPDHLAELGDRYFQQGDRARALETWQRMRALAAGHSDALAKLGEVYLEHDLADEALEVISKGIELAPGNLALMKTYAMALERAASGGGAGGVVTFARWDEARALWERILATTTTGGAGGAGGGAGHATSREARSHLVSIWGATHRLDAQRETLSRRFSPPRSDLEAGRLLAEVELRQNRLDDAERTLRRLQALANGDSELPLQLERVLVAKHDLAGAIKVLEALALTDPPHARELYERMAGYALEIYRDDDAIRYARRAVALAPDEAAGHRRLGEMLRKRQDFAGATRELRSALLKDPRLFPVYFDLAELVISQGRLEEARELYHQVIRTSPDDEFIARAARRCMQLDGPHVEDGAAGQTERTTRTERGAWAQLERVLLPLALGNPGKRIYRRLLMESYATVSGRLLEDLNAEPGGDGDALNRPDGTPPGGRAQNAQAILSAIATRGIQPLLDALGDPSQAATAIELLSFSTHRDAALPLFAFSQGTADLPLRIRALMAAGRLRAPELLPKLARMLEIDSENGGDRLRGVAAWGIAQLRSPNGFAPLAKLLANDANNVTGTNSVLSLGGIGAETRGIAAIGLAWLHDRRGMAPLITQLGRPDASGLVHASASYALGELGDAAATGPLTAIAERGAPFARPFALYALARLGQGSREGLFARCLLDPNSEVRNGALAAAMARLSGFEAPLEGGERGQEGQGAPAPAGYRDSRGVDLRAELMRLLPSTTKGAARIDAWLPLVPALVRTATELSMSSDERALALASEFQAGDGGPRWRGIGEGLAQLPAAQRQRALEGIDAVASSLVPALVQLAGHSNPQHRVGAARFLASRREPEAQKALVLLLDDPDVEVQRSALTAWNPSALADMSNVALLRIARLVASSPVWSIRWRGAEAIERWSRIPPSARRAPPPLLAEIGHTLAESTRSDGSPWVRSAAAAALHRLDPVGAQSVLHTTAERDPEPRVRELCTRLASGVEAEFE